ERTDEGDQILDLVLVEVAAEGRHSSRLAVEDAGGEEFVAAFRAGQRRPAPGLGAAAFVTPATPVVRQDLRPALRIVAAIGVVGHRPRGADERNENTGSGA